MNDHDRAMKRLAYYGANTPVEAEECSPHQCLQSAILLLENPNARIVGCVIQAISEADPIICLHNYPVTKGVRRLGYLSNRLNWNLLSLPAEALTGDWITPHSDALSRSHMKITPDDISSYWKVISRPNLITNYVHDKR